MAMDYLASAAHAAGFAMAPVDDGAPEQAGAAADYKDMPSKSVMLTDATARWQGSSQPASHSAGQAASAGSIFNWMPSFSWRADSRR
jgi:hypothetical protein